ncbi:MAG TPA: hypothetical protein VFJ29_03980 [Candidatus Kapabacteria bacterium]|nr:hypothetical protein [Candidatus Kapabacteria bacterium]
MKLTILILGIAAIAIFSYGCLTVETKEYHFHLNADGQSGTGTITFVNIRSQMEDTVNVSKKDFTSLIEDYLKGDKLEEDSIPALTGAKKRLFEKNGMLCGEVAFTFNKLEDIGLYRYDSKSPLMYLFESLNEEYDTSNGKYGGKVMPVVFWSDTSHDLYLTTGVGKDMENTVSLLPNYNEWK